MSKQLPNGCGYQGYEFGAGGYPDSECFGGRLYDMDNCDSSGLIYEPCEYIPCPMCHPRLAVDYWEQRNRSSGLARKNSRENAKLLIADIRRNRQDGTEPWKAAQLAR